MSFSIPQKYKNVAINAVLAGVVAFTTLVAFTEKPLDKVTLGAGIVLAVRAAAGVIAAGFGKPIGTDAVTSE